MIKAIIFDCFGVLTTDGWLPFKRKHFGTNTQLYEKATELNRQANTKLISYSQFISEIAAMAKMTPEEAQRTIDMADGKANIGLFHLITILKTKYKIGMLSNTSKNMLTHLFSKEEVALFDALILSYEEGVTKPDKAAYEITARRLGVELNECVFIDDQERHCLGAKAAGMRAIQYKDFEQMKPELEKILASGSDN
jgi:HAD superfamily hydrolase (TIGR01509 family)